MKRLIRHLGGWRSRLYGLPVLVWPGLAALAVLLVILAIAVWPKPMNQPPTLPAERSLTVAAGAHEQIDLQPIADLAAEAYAGVGLLEIVEHPRDVEALCRSLKLYRKAVEVADADDRASHFAATSAEIASRLEDLGAECGATGAGR